MNCIAMRFGTYSNENQEEIHHNHNFSYLFKRHTFKTNIICNKKCIEKKGCYSRQGNTMGM